MLVRPALEKHLTTRTHRKIQSELWVSDLGSHPAKAMGRILHGQTPDFGIDTLNKMQLGNVLEADTIEAIQFSHPHVLTQFPLHDDTWSGYADAVVGHLGGGIPTIIEHKATGDKWFDYKESLPRDTHVCQLWLYGWLYEKMYGIQPELRLYYRSWGGWAEFEILKDEAGDYMVAVGYVNGDLVERQRAIAPNLLRHELEEIFQAKKMPDIPIDPNTWDYASERLPALIAMYPDLETC